MTRTVLTQNTRIWIDNVNGNDANDGLTRATAKKYIPSAWEMAYLDWDAHGYAVDLYCCNTGVPYTPGLLAAFPLLGQGHDYGLTLHGEKANGNVSVLIYDVGNGGVHVAGGAQVYVSDIGIQTDSGARPIIVPYNGFVGVDNVVFYGSNGLTPLLEAGPNKGFISLIGPTWLIGGSNFCTAVLSAKDYSAIYQETSTPQKGTLITSYGNTQIVNAGGCAVVAASDRGKISIASGFSGQFTGPKAAVQGDGMIQGIANVPGSGTMSSWKLDGTGVIL